MPIDIKKVAKIMKALSNENRLELFLEILKKQDKCFETEECECLITDIMKYMNIGAPTVSHHIKELTNAGLLITERKGKFLSAKINEETLQEAISLFHHK